MADAGSPEAVIGGMRALLSRRSDELRRGATAVGWKVGINVPALQEHFGLAGPVVGYLTDSTVMEAAGPIAIGTWVRPALEVEVAIRIGDGGGVAALAPAIELVDLDLGFDAIGPILEGNIFHRGVIFGPELTGLTLDELSVQVDRADERLAEGRLTELPATTVEVVRAFLAAHGATLAPGDRIIAGSLIAPMAIAPGDDLVVSYGPLGSLGVTFS
jgi:2-oxo-hept-3-ene-1,7-dioate hydratase